ncbi:MAG: hypothetical protein GOMPHAMPRED_003800 [Gomphillus americanus]|uniref:Uncharacterized protein n=1 Tax=Gomphillus americanus TaxID=1940652 RepID=A0A8H3IEF8_9LECA|nr:MAG: hypothetical protein GOMPHAMPRED_003800 [Gomphillus americanus]
MHTSKTVVFLAFAASISAYNWDTELDARDIDDYLAAQDLVVRAAKGGAARGGSAASWGRRIERGSNTAGNVGTALTGVADFGNMIRGGGNGKRDLEFEELMARAAKGGAARGGNAASWGRRIERGSNAAGNVGTALTGVADFGNMIRGNGKRDLEDLLFDDSELFAREEFEFEDLEY